MAKFDFKKAAVDHVEKILFGMVILIVLFGLVTTDWSSYKGTPREITQKVEQARNNLALSVWPEEERAKYALTPETAPSQVVRDELFVSISPAQYEPSTRFSVDPAGGKEPLREIEKKAPEELIATTGRVLIELLPEVDESDAAGELAMSAQPMPEEDPNIADEFRKRPGNLGGGPGGLEDEYYAPELDAMRNAENVDVTGVGPGMDLLDPLGGGVALPTKNGEGFPFVSVRAVFPVREQIARFADAMHVPFAEAARQFYIIDFELERQELQSATTWSEWEPVQIEVATDILSRSAGYDADVVNSAITDPVVTMPLPMRISGRWYSQATHPRIKNFVLDDKQIQLEMELNSLMLEKAIEERKAVKKTAVQRGGFASMSFGSNEIQSQLMGSESVYDSSAYMMESSMPAGMPGPRGSRGPQAGNAPTAGMDQLLEKLVDKNDKERKEALRGWIQERAKADGELLLFRYMDFSVEPGKTYRYRVRFKIPNPNFGRRISEADGLAHVVEGETRETEWSNITEPAAVPSNVDYFLAGVHEPNRTRNNELAPSASMEIFQWDNRYGTTMNAKLEVRSGQEIAGEVETEVIKPAENVFEKEKYKFKSTDFVADVIGDLEVDPTFHGQGKEAVKLLRGANGYMLAMGQVLVATPAGLELYDGHSRRAQLQALTSHQKQQAEYFEGIKKAQEALANVGVGSELDPYGLGSAESAMMDEYGGASSRQKNVLRRGRSKRSKLMMGEGAFQ